MNFKLNFSPKNIAILILILVIFASMSSGDAPFLEIMMYEDYEELTMLIWIYLLINIIIAVAALAEKYNLVFLVGLVSLVAIIIIDVTMSRDLGFTGIVGLIAAPIIIFLANSERTSIK